MTSIVDSDGASSVIRSDSRGRMLGVTDLHAIETSVEDVVIRLGTEAPRP